VLFDT